MTREELASKVNWHRLVWFAGILNPFMVVPQLYKVWTTGDVAGVSVTFFLILTGLQATFSLHGFFIRDKMVMWSNGCAASSTILTILSVLYFT